MTEIHSSPSIDVWAIEAACRHAWPAASEKLLAGWILRRSGGDTRRTNSMNPLGPNASGATDVLSKAARFYASYGQTLIVRVPGLLEDVSRQLEAQGFAGDTRTSTLHAELSRTLAPRGSRADLRRSADAEWIAAKLRMTPMGDLQRRVYVAMLSQIQLPICYASVVVEGRIASVAYAVLDQGIAVIESVVTDPSVRRSGLAFDAIAALLAWARTEGCTQACLQVVSDNAPAIALYRKLGFGREIYSYRYYRPASA